ncbi:Serine phosphatase RsbU, regulator of sigma subunit [Actinacidiphila yanglinensis]|uniref:Serine phosphatase RsbU, regulator of sigma subunit n=1 Tax=Actinacidiphila yanglinensis TaxID=310779 RepID=A0A1H6D9R0_9ACTN|nr:SpoIIE family protein phosphatase [Actinacidiphila yanglinensis]SEG81256.1 Serine phosphatase RsbU, regulator of sigma subunit [Actinacidiphila yanglinensis]
MERNAATPAPGSASPSVEAAASLDGRGMVTGWSARARELLGYEAAETVGGSASRLLAEPVPAGIRRSWDAGEPWSGPLSLRHRDGGDVRVRVAARPLLDAGGNPHWYLTATMRLQCAAEQRGGPPEQDTAVTKQWALEQLPLPFALYDRRGARLALNDASVRSLGMPERDLLGVRIGDYGRDSPLKEQKWLGKVVDQVWSSGETVRKEMHFRRAGDPRASALLLLFSPVLDPSGRICAVSLASVDITEQVRARQRLSILNEAGLRIGTTLDLSRTADELAVVGTDHFADFVAVDLLDVSLVGDDTDKVAADPAALFRRVAQRSVKPGVPEAIHPVGATYTYKPVSAVARAVRDGQGGIYHIDAEALRWWSSTDPARGRSLSDHGIHDLMTVPLRARGITLGLAIFCRHRTPEPFDEEDLLLAEDLAARAAVSIDNARRYTRERRVALTLQGSLLPGRARDQVAVDIAHRYLPADPSIGVGGDWFDVIPLSGARVGLVVGDVVGHGIQASATMGRLCTAVRTLADVDLAPDELLTQLDDLVLRMAGEERGGEMAGGEMAGGEVAGAAAADAVADLSSEVGATCLYAVYDPVTRRCAMARAGHPAPVLATPDGVVKTLEPPAGPPLGLGGLPFEVAEYELPEGSVLALYTDGLVERKDRDVGTGQRVLREVLGRPHRTLDDACESLLEALRPDLHTDDAALLLVRSRTLSEDHVASWELTAEPETVAHARELTRDRLEEWGLGDIGFIAELVVSELVTNAVRYGQPPIRLRLIRNDTLIFEVTDGSSTTPHLRRARAYDEGGRGLLIVAQMTNRWGCRNTETGKTIWAELPIAEADPPAL